MGSGAEVHVVHGVLKVAAAFGIKFAMDLDEPWSHAAVGMNATVLFEALRLDGACLHDALPDLRGGLADVFGGEVFVFD